MEEKSLSCPFAVIGLFMVAIFGPFLAHFWLHVWIIFRCLAEGPKNDVKNEAKNGYCEHSEMQTFQK